MRFVRWIHGVALAVLVSAGTARAQTSPDLGQIQDVARSKAEEGLAPSGGEARYYLCGELLTWNDAEVRCTSFGTLLASLHPLEERDVVRELLDGRKVHVGLSDRASEGDFWWVDGTPMTPAETSLYFAPGEPNDADSAEDCVEMNGDTVLLNDIPCASPNNLTRFLCEAACAPPS